jgi:hypothetical protein
MPHHLAQINIALARAPLDSEVMRDFTNALGEINALAETSPGFVWRFQEDNGNATAVRAFPDPRMIVNLSVWQDVASLKNYAFRSMHGRFFARRTEWFEPMTTPHLALWWIPAGTIPTLEDAKQRLKLIESHGDTTEAFTFRSPFPASSKPLT